MELKTEDKIVEVLKEVSEEYFFCDLTRSNIKNDFIEEIKIFLRKRNLYFEEIKMYLSKNKIQIIVKGSSDRDIRFTTELSR